MIVNATAQKLTLYYLISSIEEDLRSFILSNIDKENKEKIFDDVLIEKLKSRCKEIYGNKDDVSELVEFLDFGDCSNLLPRFNKIFPTTFRDKLNQLTKEIEKLVPVRNRVMHSRPLEYYDFTLVYDFVDNVEKHNIIEWAKTNKAIEDLKNDPTIVLSMNIPNYETEVNLILNNLPESEFDDTGFVGREKELAEIKKRLSNNYPVISVIGDGGVGKTALVLKCLYDLIEEDTKYDAIIWTSLKTRTLNSGEFINIENAITSTIQIYKKIDNALGGNYNNISEEEVINTLIEYMKEFKILLVIDNLETINSSSIREFLEQIPDGTKIVITSRIGIGEFESRYKLVGFNKKESIYFLRRLADIYRLDHIKKLPEKKLEEIVEKLYNNPLAIKWFVANIYKGIPIESILSHKGDLVLFCMSNVYEKLSDYAKSVIKTMLILNKESSDAEIGYLLNELTDVQRRNAINELLTTNMVVTKTISGDDYKKSHFELTEFAKEFLRNSYKPTNEEYKLITKKINELKGLGQNISLDIYVDPYNPKSLIKPSQQEELLAVYNLKNALKALATTQNTEGTINYLNKAKDIAPGYFEVYKISGFVYATLNDLYKADNEYKTAIQCKPNYAPLLYLYAGFQMRYLDDFEQALSYTLEAELLDPQNIDIKLQKARIYSLLNKYDSAEIEFTNIINNYKNIKEKTERITYYYYLDNFRRWAEKFKREEKYNEAMNKLYEVLSKIDISMIDPKADNTVGSMVLDLFNLFDNVSDVNELANIITKLFEKYSERILFTDSYKSILAKYNKCKCYFDDIQKTKIEMILKQTSDSINKDNKIGKIRTIRDTFGFIKNEEFDDGIFFHRSACVQDFACYNEGDRVSFSVDSREERPKAINVDKI